nr:alkylmercury lyase family protein [Streptomyces sp. NBC_01001]
MRITVLTVPDCPNGPVAQERIAAALAGRAAEVECVEVREEADAARLGMTGSPTVLLDGVDPFAVAGATPSISCRVYRDGGRVEGAPSVAALRTALADAGLEPDPLDPIGRGGRGRVAPAERGLRAAHQAVLRHFATTGRAPGADALEPVAAAAGRTVGDVLAELDREDFLTLDEDGQVRAAYPFCAVPTPHRVRIDGGAEVWSMCAVDALGIAAMLGRNTVISSTDPVTGEPVTVTSTDGTTVWEPASAVVFVGHRAVAGPAEAVCCGALNFFTSRTSATTWSQRHPDVRGDIVGQDRAEELGRRTFGPLLATVPRSSPDSAYGPLTSGPAV